MLSDVGAQQLDFELQVGDGRGALLLRPTVFHGWLQVDRLALAIPDVAFPLDITKGIAQFKEQRCRVTSASLGIDEGSLEALLRDRAPILSAAGFQEVRIRLLQDFTELSGRAYVGEESADFAARVYVSAVRRGIRLRLTDARTFGFLRRPAPLLAHDLICVLLGAVAPPTDDQGDAEVAVYRGLGDFLLPALDLFLCTLFPAAGWRIPESPDVRVDEVDLSGGRADISYGTAAEAPAEELDDAVPGLRALDSFTDADTLLRRGGLGGAMGAYRFALTRDAAHERFLTERLLAVLCTRESTLREADRLARVALGRWPDFAPAHLALASVSVARDELAAAADHFAEVARLAEEGADDEEAVRASLAVARHLVDVDGQRATRFYERVLERRPNHREAADALTARYREEERWAEFVVLWRQRIAGLANDRERARAHVQLAEVFHGKLDDPDRAASELKTAVELDEEYIHAWDALADILEEMGRDTAAIQALERVGELQQVKRDTVGEVRTRSHLVSLLERIGDDAQALAACKRALEIRPDDAGLLERSAAICARMGEPEAAIEIYERIIDICPAADPHGERAAAELLPLFIEIRALERARRHLQRCAIDPDSEVLVALAALESDSGESDSAAATLERAVLGLEGTRAAAVEAIRARLLIELERGEEATESYSRAYAQAPGSEAGLEAARALVQAARASGDTDSETLWLHALLADDNELSDRADLALRLASLHQTCGDAAAALTCLDHALEAGLDVALDRPLRAEVLGALGDEGGRAQLLEAMAEEADDDEERAAHLVEAARAHLSAGDARAALARARQAFECSPDDTEVQRVFGEAAWRARAWEEIATAYDALLPEAEPEERSRCALRLGLALERQGRQQAAQGCYRTAIELPDASGAELAESWRNLAELCVRLGDYQGAAEAYESAAGDERTGEEPNQRARLYVRAAEILHRRKGAVKEALAQLDAALALAPDHLPSLDALEAIHAENGNYELVAATLWKKIQVCEEGSPQEKALLARLMELQSSVLGKAEDARQSCERLLELDPDNVSALRFLARNALEREELDRAEERYARLEVIEARRAVREVGEEERVAERIETLSALASIRRRLDRLDEAEATVMQAMVLAPRAAQEPLLVELEAIYARGERFVEQADVLAQRAEALEDHDARLPLVKQRIHLYLDAIGDLDAAAGICRAAVERWPDDAELAELGEMVEAAAWRAKHEQVTTTASGAVVRIGLAEGGAGGEHLATETPASGSTGAQGGDDAQAAVADQEMLAAIERLETDLTNLPRDAVSRFTALRHELGELHLRRGDVDAARHYLELVLAEEPTRVSALELLTDLYLGAREWESAVEALERLSRLGHAPERRAELLFQMGEVCRVHLLSEERASDAYLKASDLDPNHVPTLRRLVDFYWADGDHQGLGEVATELEEKNALFVADTEACTLARVGVAAAGAKDRERASRAALFLGAAGAQALAVTLAEAVCSAGSAQALEGVARLMCVPPGPSAPAVRSELASHRAEVGDDDALQALDEILARID